VAGPGVHDRPPIGPGTLGETEYVLSTVSGLGLPVHRVNTAAVAIAALVTGHARLAAETELLRRATGQTNEAWWLRRSTLWEDWFDVERPPSMTNLWNAGGFDRGPDEQAADAYAYTLELRLSGIEADAG
jgi:hypothetical protein